MVESFAANTVSRFRHPKTKEEESRLLQGSIPNQLPTKSNGRLKFFTNGRLIEKLQFLYLMLVALLKIMQICTKLSH